MRLEGAEPILIAKFKFFPLSLKLKKKVHKNLISYIKTADFFPPYSKSRWINKIGDIVSVQ